MARLKISVDHESGRRVGWARHVTAVDSSKRDGYAFDGEFIPEDTEVDLSEGAVVLKCQPRGSVAHGYKIGQVFVIENGQLVQKGDDYYDWRKEFLTLRDLVADLLQTADVDPYGLASVPLDILKAEVARRES